MPRNLDYRAYNGGTASTNRYAPYIRSAMKGVQFAWKHRKQVQSAARATANTIKQVRKKYGKAPMKRSGRAYSRNLKQALQGTSQHNDTSTRFFKVIIRKGRRLKRGSAISKKKHHFKYTENWQNVINGAEGVQTVSECKMIGTKDQLNGTASTARNLTFASADSYYELNPFRVNTGSALYPAGTTGTPMTNDKLYYRSVAGTLKVVNLESLATYVTILWVKCKKTTASGPNLTWSNSAVNERMGTGAPGAAAVTTAALATPGWTSTSVIGNIPQMYQSFRSNWKVIHREKFYLQGGDQVDIKFNFQINKLIDRQTINEAAGRYMANMTIVPLVIQYGALTAITDIPAATVTNEVVHGRTKLGFAVVQNHEFGPVPAETRTPTGRYFPGMVEGTTHVIDERQVDDTDEADVIKVA